MPDNLSTISLNDLRGHAKHVCHFKLRDNHVAILIARQPFLPVTHVGGKKEKLIKKKADDMWCFAYVYVGKLWQTLYISLPPILHR